MDTLMKKSDKEYILSQVKKELSSSEHDMSHVMRVLNTATSVAKNYKLDRDVLVAATLLHDIGRVREDKNKGGDIDHAVEGAKMAEDILSKLGWSNLKIEHVKACIISHRSKTDKKPESIEARILHDCDKLDSVGAIGVARCFVWIGKQGARVMHKDLDIEEYIKDNLEGGKRNGRIKDKTKHSVFVEYQTKVKYMYKDMTVKEVKDICSERIKFFKNFLDRMVDESEGRI
jgi:uncharacterized protein